MKSYTTIEVARLIGIHPNTVRRYEELKLVSPPKRQANGYRIFTDEHIRQFRIARTAFQTEVLQNGLRKEAVAVVKTCALGAYTAALCLAEEYLAHIRRERARAEEAVAIVEQILHGAPIETDSKAYSRKEITGLLRITMDTLRNWERNGLLRAKRKQNGYRMYDAEDMKTLKLIRTLRCADYSLSAILRMLSTLKRSPDADIRTILNTPEANEPIVSVYDRLLASLRQAEDNAKTIIAMLAEIKIQNANPPL